MIYLKSELSKILGKIEELDRTGQLTCDHVYPLLEEAYLLISDYFEIDQCHSIIHQLTIQMRELKKCIETTDMKPFEINQLLKKVKRTTMEELRIFISHL
jgi:hypothetical protein